MIIIRVESLPFDYVSLQLIERVLVCRTVTTSTILGSCRPRSHSYWWGDVETTMERGVMVGVNGLIFLRWINGNKGG